MTQFARRQYTSGWTPLERLDNLSAALGGPTIYIKRDDLLGLAGGGNKTRKLEFVVAEAIAQGADTLITTGAVQSNHCRLTLAAAAREGLKCRLVIEERIPDSYDPQASGNNLLFSLLGVEKVIPVRGGADLNAIMEAEKEALSSEGRIGYVIPGGASNPLGALGYVACANEILQQCFEMGLNIDRIVCASGSGGTHAGLVTGMLRSHSGIPVIGVSVRAERQVQEQKLWELAKAIGRLLEIDSELPRSAFSVVDDYVGEGYSVPTPGMIEAVHMFAQLEGILLDPVYTGKAAAGLIELARRGTLKKDENILFLHTGGSPALFAYSNTFQG